MTRHSLLRLLLLLCCCTPAWGGTVVNVRVLLGWHCHGDYPMESVLAENLLLPLSDPYKLGHTPPMQFLMSDITDWIVLEFRTRPDIPGSVAVAALLRNDGQVVFTDGSLPQIPEEVLPHGEYYIVVSHRTHLDIMSAVPVHLDAESALYDFTSDSGAVYNGNSLPNASQGTLLYTMAGGDFLKDNRIDKQDSLIASSLADFYGYEPPVLVPGMADATARVLMRNSRGKTSAVPNARIYPAAIVTKGSILAEAKRLNPALFTAGNVEGTWEGTFFALEGEQFFIRAEIESLSLYTSRLHWEIAIADTASYNAPIVQQIFRDLDSVKLLIDRDRATSLGVRRDRNRIETKVLMRVTPDGQRITGYINIQPHFMERGVQLPDNLFTFRLQRID